MLHLSSTNTQLAYFSQLVTWDRIEWARSLSTLPIVLKGIATDCWSMMLCWLLNTKLMELLSQIMVEDNWTVYLINARRMRTRVTVLTLCVCLCGVCWRHKTVIQHGEHENKLFAKFTTFSTHVFL